MILPASLSARDFAALSRHDQLDVLRRATTRQKVRLLVDAADGRELLAQMSPQDLFLIAKEHGPDQLPELLGMATPEQWTAFFDFDCWEGDRFASATAREWLAILLQGEESSVVLTLLEIDFELLVLLLHGEVQVLSGPEEMDDEAAMAESRRRDRGYVLEYRDDDGAKLFGALIELLLRNVPDFCRYLLEAVRSEGESLLEESVYQMRADRLLDQGLPDAYTAQAVFAWLDPDQFAVRKETKRPLGGSPSALPPSGVLQLARPGRLLSAVLAGDNDPEVAWELACLVNKVLMAERIDPGDLNQVREAAELTCATLELALEQLAGSDVQSAQQSVRNCYVEQLFRLGHSLTLRLQRRAQGLRASAIAPYLDAHDRSLLEALLRRRPQFPESLIHPGRGETRPFASLDEVRLAEERLDRLEVQRRLFIEHFPFPLPSPGEWSLEGCHPAHGNELTLAGIFLTALANRLSGGTFAPEPLPAAGLMRLHALVSLGGRLTPEVREQTLAWLESLEPGGGIFGAASLDLWEEDFCSVEAVELDPRYLASLIVRFD